MTNQPLSTVGLVMPGDFPVLPYEGIHRRVTAKKQAYPNAWAQYAGAWNAVAYRFLSCADHDKAFTESVRRFGDAPLQPERYAQERELFGFFVTGLATIESFCYGLYAIASMVDSRNFPLVTQKDMRSVNRESTTKRFKRTFPSDNITHVLDQTVSTQEFKDWKEIRNILAHRSAPPRHFFASTAGKARAALWLNGIQIDENITASWRKWLATTMSVLLEATDDFTARHP